MRIRFVLMLVVVVGWALTSSVGLAEPQDEKARLADLIARLGSDSYKNRETAMKALEEAGPAAVEALRKAIKNDDFEIRKRASELVGTIQHQEDVTKLLAPKKVSLRYKDTPIPEALTDFSRQAGFLIEVRGDTTALAKKTITLETGVMPFWEALDLFCQKAGLTEPSLLPKPQPGKDGRLPVEKPAQDVVRDHTQKHEGIALPGNGAVVVLVEGTPPPVSTTTLGGVRIRQLPADRNANVPWLGEDEKVVTLEFLPHPGVGWNDVMALRISRAVDDKGQGLSQPMVYVGDSISPNDQNDLMIWDAQGYYPYGYDNGSNPSHIPVRLKTAKHPSTMLRELSGVVTARVQTPRQPLMTVETVLRAKGQPVKGPDGGSLSVIETSRDSAERLVVRAVLTAIPKQADEAAQVFWGRGRAMWARKAIMAWRFNGETDDTTPDLVLVDDRGQPFHRVGMDQEANPKATGTQYRLVFQPHAGQSIPAKLVWYGRRTSIIDVPFTLRDLPLR